MTLVESNPLDVMIQNLWWAAGYNIIALPLAVGVLEPWGINTSPDFGVLLNRQEDMMNA